MFTIGYFLLTLIGRDKSSFLKANQRSYEIPDFDQNRKPRKKTAFAQGKSLWAGERIYFSGGTGDVIGQFCPLLGCKETASDLE